MSVGLAIGMGVVLGVFVPWVAIRMLVPSLSQGSRVLNYRGREVFFGLGVVWLVWAGCAIAGGIIASVLQGDAQPSVLPVLTLAGPLALVAFALGMVDDALGSGASRGFRGHLSAMAHGRLTTGGLKLVGISLASLIVALVMSDIAPWAGYQGGPGGGLNALLAVVAGAAIALTSNFVNLTDLRPGRALKVSSLLLAFGVVSTGVFLVQSPLVASGGFVPAEGVGRLVDVVALALFAFGPVVAVWRYDLGEKGMLGDAGANPMGAVAGLLIVAGLPQWGLGVYALCMLALNLVSETVSFSAVIERSAILSRIDAWGRDGRGANGGLNR